MPALAVAAVAFGSLTLGRRAPDSPCRARCPAARARCAATELWGLALG